VLGAVIAGHDSKPSCAGSLDRLAGNAVLPGMARAAQASPEHIELAWTS
jgi:hypothetical protein